MPIRKLSALLINQIAAGEVIERPASVVKELVENSLDAGAARIDVAIEEGGRQLIRVSDDGGGIAAAELPLAVAAHATSKLDRPEQLAAITTLGFRGEALASIASVSRLRITSRAQVDGRLAEAGAVIEASGEHVGDVTPTACGPGTSIEVRDLFFNTPARRKFMRAAATEFGHIADVINRMAMVHPHIAFRLSHNGRLTAEYTATRSRRQRCVAVLGQELDEALLEFEHEAVAPRVAADAMQAASVWGLAGLPELARATARFQHLFINGRPIRDRGLTHAIREAYRGLIPPDKQPVVVVCLDLPPDSVDVNVHPAKSEVRFSDPQRVHGLVLAALRQRLLGSDLTPQARIAPATGPTLSPAQAFAPASPSPGGDGPIKSSDFVDYFRRMDPGQKGFVFQEVKRALAEDDPTFDVDAADRDTTATASSASQATKREGDGGGGVLPSASVLQVHKSYLVTQDDEGILIVDQHALHERVMFETLQQRVLGEGRNLESQRLLMPATLPATPGRLDALEQLKPLLTRIGIEAEPIGPSAIGVHAFPSFLFDRHVEPVGFLEDLFDKVEAGDLDAASPSALEAALHEVLDMMACKAAVKAGDKMSPDELAALLAKRDAIERSSNCPHGRPTTLRLTLRELEKQFKRT